MSGTQIDLAQEAEVRMTLSVWNGALLTLRTGSGPGITWEVTNPAIMAISQQLQRQMYPQAGAQQEGRPNGQDNDEAASIAAAQGLRAPRQG